MFSLSSLVGSSRPERGLEFTPIGRRAAPNKTVPPASGLDPHFEPSFDNSPDSSDTLHSMSIDGVSPGRQTPFTDAFRVPEANFKAKTLLGSGSNSISDLQTEIKELSGENYNLKVEVATLTKILKQTPPELHDLASENVYLKQEIVRLSTQLSELARAQNTSGLDAKLQEKEYQIQTLEQRIKQTQNEYRTPPELLEQLEFLKGENQKLIRRLEAEKPAFSPGKLGILESENNELKTELYRLKTQALEVPKDAQARLERAEQQTRMQAQQIDDLNEEIRSKSAEIRSKAAELETIKNSTGARSPAGKSFERELELEELRQKNVELNQQNVEIQQQNSEFKQQNLEMNQKNEEQRREVSRLMQENEHLSRSRTSEDNRKVETTLSELRKAQSDLRQKEHMIRDLQEDKESEVARVQAKMASLRREVQAKDEEEAALKAQIRTLLNERSSGVSSASVRHYEAQLDQMRSKENRLALEIRNLKDENAALHDELYSNNISKRNEQSEKYQAEISELSDKLAFYEKEYDLIQDAMEDTEKEKEQLKAQNSRLNDEHAALQVELESAKSRLRRLEMQEAQKVNESVIFELEDAHRKRAQAEQRRMAAQNEALSLQISDLEKKLAQKSSETDLDELRRSLARLQIQVSEKEAILAEKARDFERLQHSVREKEAIIAEKARDFERLQKSMREKDELTEALEARIRDLNRDLNRDLGRGSSRGGMGVKAEYEYQIRTLELENERLRDLKVENDRLRDLLESERMRDLRMEHERFRELNDSERLKQFKESDRIRELTAENERLKDFVARCSLDFAEGNKVRYDSDMRQKEELQRAQYELDNLRKVQVEVEALRKEQADNTRLQRDLQDEIRFYKTKLETLMDSDSAVQPVIALLESEVDNYRQQNKELNEKLDQLREKMEAANDTKLQQEKAQFMAEKEQVWAETDSERKAIVQDLQAANQRLHEEKARTYKTIESLEEDCKGLKAEKTRLENRTKTLAQELSKTSRHCTRLANRIHEMGQAKAESTKAEREADEARKRMGQMQGEIDQLSRNLAGAKIQAKDKGQKEDKDKKERAKLEARVLRNESNFFKAKLFDINLKCNDLALMNTFMVNAIKSSDKSMRNDLVKMAQCGIYPDYTSTTPKPKLTMKLLATFVLSMVKMKRRAEKARARTLKMDQLRAEIDRDRITLIAEPR